MAYVDLNPQRAKLANTPESSDYTSVKTRAIKAKQLKKEFKNPNSRRSQPINLFPFVGSPRKNMPVGLPFKLEDYLELVDWTGRQIRKGKRGSIDASEPPILSRLGISSENWLVSSTQFESQFKGFAGVIEKIRTVCESLGRQRASASLSCLG